MFSEPNELLEKLSRYDNHKSISMEEFEFMYYRMTAGRNKNYAFGTLPYVTPTEKALADSIAKKLKFNKFYRGPRTSYYSTYKADATGVALYMKP